jgi:hypothetical protein
VSDQDEVDVDEPTVEVIRANYTEIQRLSDQLAQGGSDAGQVRLAVELVNASKRHEGVLSEVPGLEGQARQLEATRAEIEAHYDL